MMNPTLIQPAEGPLPLYAQAPPDQQPMDLQGALAMVDSIVWRDGGMDPEEQRLLMAWFQSTMMKAQAVQQAAQQGQGAPPPSGLGSSSVSDKNVWGGPGSSPARTFDEGYDETY